MPAALNFSYRYVLDADLVFLDTHERKLQHDAKKLWAAKTRGAENLTNKDFSFILNV